MYDDSIKREAATHSATEKRDVARTKVRVLTARLQSAREDERIKVAREIHDELGQALSATKIDGASLVRDMHADEKQQKKAEPVLRLVDHTIQSVRRIATELRTGVLDHLGNEIVIDPERATAIFRIFQESLTHIARHANASQVDIRLSEDHGDVVLQVRDNGRGIGEEQVTTAKSLGILGMRERAHLLGGELTISGSAERGTMVRVRIPEAGK